MDLCSRYRPSCFDEVIGHRSVILSLKRVLSDKTLLPHAFLFSGPSGVGKTTLARILAQELGCKSYNILEQDAVTQNSVDSMRELIANLRYPAMGGNPYRVLILDEAHALTTMTYNTLLQNIEEPPAHLFYIFCTTEVKALPNTLLTRLHHFPLKPVSVEDILQYLYKIKITEDFKISDEALLTIAKKAEGSVRQALSFLSPLRDSTGIDANEILEPDLDAASENFRPLFSAICEKSQKDDSKILELLRCMPYANPETIRQGLIQYATRTLFYSDNPDIITHEKIMKAFGIPCISENKMADFILKLYAYLHL